MTSDCQLRRATERDAPQILECLAGAFAPYRKDYTDGAWIDTVLTPEALQHRLVEMTVLVAVDGAEMVVGTVGYKSEQDGEAHLRGMAVRPGSHGAGVAQALLDRVEADLRGLGCKVLTLDTTRPLQRAIRFYEKNGFHATGQISEFYGMELLAYQKELTEA